MLRHSRPGRKTLQAFAHPFERALSVSVEDIDFELRGTCTVPWSDFLLNPRLLRGADFLMRWSQGQWSEHRLIEAVNKTPDFFAIPYGPSSVAPDSSPRDFELYFERLEAAGLGNLKRPDLLVFSRDQKEAVDRLLQSLGGELELPFAREDLDAMQDLLRRSLVAIECENSLWKAKQMPQFGAALRPQNRLGGKLGLPKGAVLPTVILKEEDRGPLLKWQESAPVRIHIWHVFFDLAYGISLDKAEELISSGHVEPRQQIFQAPGGATTTKTIYNIHYHHAYPLGESTEAPSLVANYLISNSGHILPWVQFEGGSLQVAPEALEVLQKLTQQRR